jgi:hypothetical protein
VPEGEKKAFESGGVLATSFLQKKKPPATPHYMTFHVVVASIDGYA